MWWSGSADPDAAANAGRRRTAHAHALPRILVPSFVVLVGCIAYGAAMAIPAWETDTWVLNLLAQRTLHAGSWSDALAVSRFVLENPKGWSDSFILASWFGVYALSGGNVVVFHAIGITSHLVTALLVARLAEDGSKSRWVALWSGALFAALPLSQDVVAVEAHSQYPLFGALFLSAWLLLQRWRDRGNHAALAVALVLYVLALATKELSFALPPLILLEIAALRAAPGADPAARARAWIGLSLATAVAVPFVMRPFWVAMANPERATSPADAAMLRDLTHYLVPWVLVPKMALDLGRWGITPFADEGAATRWFPLNAMLSTTTFFFGVAALARDRVLSRWRWVRPAVWILLGYLPVGFQLDRSSFEKTGELYLAAVGMALAWGELVGSGTTLRRTRAALGGATLLAMLVHLQVLHHAMQVHGDRVQAAVRGLEGELDSAPPGGGIVIVGEERLDRGAIDAVVLQIAHDRQRLAAPISWIGGGGSRRQVDRCPEGVWVVDTADARLIGWNDEASRFERLDDPARLGHALAWRNPDPERVWIRDACVVTHEGRTLLTTEVLKDLSPDAILRRL